MNLSRGIVFNRPFIHCQLWVSLFDLFHAFNQFFDSFFKPWRLYNAQPLRVIRTNTHTHNHKAHKEQQNYNHGSDWMNFMLVVTAWIKPLSTKKRINFCLDFENYVNHKINCYGSWLKFIVTISTHVVDHLSACLSVMFSIWCAM